MQTILKIFLILSFWAIVDKATWDSMTTDSDKVKAEMRKKTFAKIPIEPAWTMIDTSSNIYGVVYYADTAKQTDITAGELNDLKKVIDDGKANAAGVGSLFVFKNQGQGALINFPDREQLNTVRRYVT